MTRLCWVQCNEDGKDNVVYANMSAERKMKLIRCQKEARAKEKAMTIEMKDLQIGKIKLHFNRINDTYLRLSIVHIFIYLPKLVIILCFKSPILFLL